MYIKKIHIYSFGKWKNIFFDTDSNMVILKGPNESGKTSLKQFILYILFDLPSVTKKLYEPKDGSSLGGRLFLYDENRDTTIIVERVANKGKGRPSCVTEEGTDLGADYINELLKGMDRHTYESIFSFNDQDLQKIKLMKGEDLGRVLFGLGMSGTEKITQLEASLNKQMDEWYKKKGKKPIINTQLAKMKNLKSKINELEQLEEDYNQLVFKKEELIKAINAMNEQLKEKKEKQLCIDKYFQAQEAITQYKRCENKLREYKEIDSFPLMGLERRSQLKEFILPIESSIHGLEEKLNKWNHQMEDIKEKLIDDELYEELQRLESLYQEYRYLHQQLEEKGRELDKLKIAYQHERKNLGITFDAPISSFPLSMFTEETWKSLVKQQEEAEKDFQNLTSSKQQLLMDKEMWLERKEQLEQSLLEEDEYSALKEKIQIQQVNEWRQQFFQEQKVKDESRKRKTKKVTDQLNKAGNLFFISGIIACIGLLIYAYMNEKILGYLFAVSGLLVGILAKLVTNRMVTVMKKELEHPVIDPFEPSLSSEQIKQYKDKVQIHEKAMQELKELSEKIEQLEKQLIIIEEKLEEHSKLITKIEKQILEEEKQYPFLQSVSIAYWPALYHKLIKLVEMERELQQKQNEMDKVNNHLQCMDEKINDLASACGRNIAGNNDGMWEVLKDIYHSEVKRRDRLQQLQQEIMEAEEQKIQLQKELEPYKKELQELFTKAQAENEEQFIEKGKKYEEKQRLIEKQEEWLHQIQVILQNETAAALEKDIPWSQLELEHIDLSEEIKRWNEELENKRQSLANCYAQLKQLEENEQLSTLRHQYALLKGELRNYVKQYVTLKAANHFLQKTKELYQKEYLPEIIEKTTYYFKELTGGRYVQMLPPASDETIMVESSDHQYFKIAELSTGTTAQMYTSLRLALSEAMSSNYCLPFLIDDAFVHFDGIRKEVMLNLLKQIKEKQQILYFTCEMINFEDKMDILHVDLQPTAISI
jgi:uncharacterized protein YhaN